MKKLVLVMLALFLVIPAMSNAGSVSSRYDVTFGGFVKMDVGWSSQSNNADPARAARSSSSSASVYSDEFSNTFMTGAETRFNFLIKGPDLWGAKTSAFIEGDFRGTTTGNAHGAFQLRHAFMKMQWPGKSELMIGQNWQQWGSPYYPAMIGANDFAPFLKGIRTPQVAFRYFFNKEFNAMFGITSATDWAGGIRQNDTYSQSNWPGLMGEVAYYTDRCGKIGPHMMRFAVGGYYGQQRPSIVDPQNLSTYKSDTLNAWIAAFRYSVPIIPEKKGNKQMALLLNGNFFIGQNPGGFNSVGLGNVGGVALADGDGWLAPGTSMGAYVRPNGDFTAPTFFGLYAQASWWLTNNLWLNGMYGYLRYNYSQYGRGSWDDATAGAIARRGNVSMQQQYALNLLWDANQAIRFGVQWMTMFTQYGGKGAGTIAVAPATAEGNGTIDQYRIAAWYFF